MLIVKGFVKKYKGSKTPNLKGVSFVVRNGEVFGIVGRNGAGKSTTIKSIMGIIPFNQGQISIDEYDVVKSPNKAKSLIGYVPDDHSIYENLTGREYVNFMADIYKVSKELREERIKTYGDMLNISQHLDRQIKGYSHGMRQKVCIIGALVHDPRLWVLDEPFLGLDSQSVASLKSCIEDYTKNKKHMVVFTSHNLDTVIEICDKVCVIENGDVKDVINLKKEGGEEKLRQLMA